MLLHLPHWQENSRSLQRMKQPFLNKAILMRMTRNHVKSILTFAHHITKDITQPPITKDPIRLFKRGACFTYCRQISSQKTAGKTVLGTNAGKF